MTKRFTGRHMAMIMIAFFGTIIAVNLTMATFATRTFGGKVVDNSYVASQHFNEWLEEGRAQARLGWDVALGSDSAHVVAQSVAGAQLSAVASHPLGRLPEQRLSFVEQAPGRYVAREALGPGRWRVLIDVRRGADKASFLKDVHL